VVAACGEVLSGALSPLCCSSALRACSPGACQ